MLQKQKKKQETLECPQFSQISSWVLAAFIAQRKQKWLELPQRLGPVQRCGLSHQSRKAALTFRCNFKDQPFRLRLRSTFSLQVVLSTLHVIEELLIPELIPTRKGPEVTPGGPHPIPGVFLLGYSLLNSHSQLLDFALNGRFYFALLQGVLHKESFQNERHEDTARNNEHNYTAAVPYWLPLAPDFGHQLQSWSSGI